MEKFGLSHAQQVPKPRAPGPDNIPPLPPPDIPVPDPAPPPIENPGDVPLPPITDPDLIEPGDPNPAHSPIRVRSVKRSPEYPAANSSARNAGAHSRNERSNLFPTCSGGGELGDQSNTDGTKPSASANDRNPQNWSG